jgi:hypothetical protein
MRNLNIILVGISESKRLIWGGIRHRYSPLDVATGYGLNGQVSIPGRGKRFFSASQRPDRL